MIEKNPRYSRQDGIVPQQALESQKIAIIGVGAVGREVGRTLSCNGAKDVTIFDFDTVEEHNCTTQGYHDADIGRAKVECTAEEMLRLNKTIQVTAVNDRWRPSKDKKFDAAFFCVDSLSMREKLFNWFSKSTEFIADSRIGGEQIRLVSASDKSSRLHYPTTISADVDAYADGCHISMVKHSANIAASLLVQKYIMFLKGMDILYPDSLFNLMSYEITILPTTPVLSP